MAGIALPVKLLNVKGECFLRYIILVKSLVGAGLCYCYWVKPLCVLCGERIELLSPLLFIYFWVARLHMYINMSYY